MERQDGEALRAERQLLESRRGAGLLSEPEERVDHHVADVMDALARDPFPQQVLDGGRLRGEAVVGQRVGHDAVDLFGHAAVEAAQPGLDVGQGQRHLVGDEAGGDRRRDVTHHHHEIRAGVGQHRGQAHHDLGGLGDDRAGVDPEVDVGPRDLELGEEPPGHAVVVVLARVNEPRPELRMVPHLGQQGRGLHEVRARADHERHVDERRHDCASRA